MFYSLQHTTLDGHYNWKKRCFLNFRRRQLVKWVRFAQHLYIDMRENKVKVRVGNPATVARHSTWNLITCHQRSPALKTLRPLLPQGRLHGYTTPGREAVERRRVCRRGGRAKPGAFAEKDRDEG